MSDKTLQSKQIRIRQAKWLLSIAQCKMERLHIPDRRGIKSRDAELIIQHLLKVVDYVWGLDWQMPKKRKRK